MGVGAEADEAERSEQERDEGRTRRPSGRLRGSAPVSSSPCARGLDSCDAVGQTSPEARPVWTVAVQKGAPA